MAHPHSLTPSPQSSQRTAISYLFWLATFLGFAGLHRLYNGKITSGLLWLFTWGLFGFGQAVDLFLIPGMAREKASKDSDRFLATGHYSGQSGLLDAVSPATPQALTIQLLQIAQTQGGQITVPQAVLATGADFGEVESALKNLMKSGYAHIDNDPDSGVVVYSIPGL
ncbi:TM2 domain-containing protein [Almyronema epifaneia]|uniref:TM2 domain-containing protein n=1 Tax=Almyronema epifaneia S1 TaxID=2991925 RepID=A0ABW6IHM5_9CYAN